MAHVIKRLLSSLKYEYQRSKIVRYLQHKKHKKMGFKYQRKIGFLSFKWIYKESADMEFGTNFTRTPVFGKGSTPTYSVIYVF